MTVYSLLSPFHRKPLQVDFVYVFYRPTYLNIEHIEQISHSVDVTSSNQTGSFCTNHPTRSLLEETTFTTFYNTSWFHWVVD